MFNVCLISHIHINIGHLTKAAIYLDLDFVPSFTLNGDTYYLTQLIKIDR